MESSHLKSLSHAVPEPAHCVGRITTVERAKAPDERERSAQAAPLRRWIDVAAENFSGQIAKSSLPDSPLAPVLAQRISSNNTELGGGIAPEEGVAAYRKAHNASQPTRTALATAFILGDDTGLENHPGLDRDSDPATISLNIVI